MIGEAFFLSREGRLRRRPTATPGVCTLTSSVDRPVTSIAFFYKMTRLLTFSAFVLVRAIRQLVSGIHTQVTNEGLPSEPSAPSIPTDFEKTRWSILNDHGDHASAIENVRFGDVLLSPDPFNGPKASQGIRNGLVGSLVREIKDVHRGRRRATSQNRARNTKKIYLLLRLSLAEGSQGEEGYSNDFVAYLDGRDGIFTHL